MARSKFCTTCGAPTGSGKYCTSCGGFLGDGAALPGSATSDAGAETMAVGAATTTDAPAATLEAARPDEQPSPEQTGGGDSEHRAEAGQPTGMSGTRPKWLPFALSAGTVAVLVAATVVILLTVANSGSNPKHKATATASPAQLAAGDYYV